MDIEKSNNLAKSQKQSSKDSIESCFYLNPNLLFPIPCSIQGKIGQKIGTVPICVFFMSMESRREERKSQ
jgi:hypothetical protein